MREAAAIVIDAIGRFLADDGWPISSNIALAMLTSVCSRSSVSGVGWSAMLGAPDRLRVGAAVFGVSLPGLSHPAALCRSDLVLPQVEPFMAKATGASQR